MIRDLAIAACALGLWFGAGWLLILGYLTWHALAVRRGGGAG